MIPWVISDQSAPFSPPNPLHVNFSGGGGQHVHDALVGNCHHTVVVDLDDAVPHPNAAPLRNSAAQQGTDLWGNISQIGAGDQPLPLRSAH